MNKFSLSRYLRRKPTKRKAILFALSLPVLSAVSYFVFGSENGCTPESPGGVYFETAFWLTSIGTAFLSFIMMEVLFRSRETRLLASLPVKPLQLFFYQMRRVFGGIILSTLPCMAFWFPQVLDAPGPVILSMLMWPAGLSVCAVTASAIILYTGNAGTRSHENAASFGTTAFSMAPAAALAVSLGTTLLIKLLAEALLKTGFVDAALTALGIVSAVFVIAFLYSARLYSRRYYAILACFIDTDMIQLNASYDFIDGKQAERIRQAKTPQAAFADSLVIQFERRHALSAFLVLTFAIIMALVLWNSPEYLDSLLIPAAAAMPWLIFSKPWAAFYQSDFHTGLIETLPIDRKKIEKARLTASLRILLRHGSFLAVSAALPYFIHRGIAEALINGGLTFFLCAVMTVVLDRCYSRVFRLSG